MRVATKLVLALMVGIVAVLVLHTYLHVRGLTSLYEREMRDDVAILGRALASATAELWGVAGPEQARRYVEQANVRHARTEIRLTELPVAKPAPPGTPTPEVVLQGDTLTGRVPIAVRGFEVGAIELHRVVGIERADLEGIIQTQVLFTILLALVCSVIAVGVGIVLVGRPVEKLALQAQRVAAGDFTTEPDVRSRDELGKLAEQMNRMARQLAVAREVAHEQNATRTALLEQLRHADRLSTLGKVASAIAHQLGTPLNVIEARAALIASGDTQGDDVASEARIIRDQVHAMTATVRQLLDFSRRQGVERKPVAVADLLQQARTLLEPIAEQRGVVISSQTSLTLRGMLDGARALQILTNLVVNAIQAMPQGGEVMVSAEPLQVSEPADRHSAPGRYLRLAVQDHGVGITEQDRRHIFEPFFTTKAVGQGTGLGLSVCQGIVRELGGWLEVWSEPGEGSCFTAFLPMEEAP